ncbi:MAG TPA: HAMP domain-containing sensor histidine kinase [Vicinamibacterales bacterium]|nr:HAMP domain-containing sensor histidine kinase [Vicinamibacterales bacterium]
MSSPRWYRSLYWRIALGLVAFLALMLAAEAGLFLWLTDTIAGSFPARSPRRLAVLVASDVGAALAANRNLDLEPYLHEQYGDALQTFVIIMDDGRTLSNHDDVPAALVEAVREEIEYLESLGPRRFARRWGPRPQPPDGDPDTARPEAPSITPPDGPRAGGSVPFPGGSLVPDPLRPRRGQFATILVGGTPVGRVVVLPGGPPFSRVLKILGPRMAPVAGGVLVVGTAVIAFIVFGPARRRLKDVQAATERLGSGDLTARAPEHGGDEVTSLARAFNKMAEELSSRARALEASDAARRQLLADVSHELMTPLTAMRGYIETLSMTEIQLDTKTRERYLTIVTEETHRLERIIGDLLDLARLEGGGTAIRKDRVDVTSLFSRVAARHERELRERGIRLVTQVQPDCENVIGDRDRLEQALQNLAANALRHTPDGGAITLTSAAIDHDVLLSVRDTGPGIPPAHLPLIFDRFYKVDASRKAAGGSGLGLSIVRAIVERHGGTVTARNDGGAVFEIRLPGNRST